MISIIDPNNRDYDFCHNRTALRLTHFLTLQHTPVCKWVFQFSLFISVLFTHLPSFPRLFLTSLPFFKVSLLPTSILSHSPILHFPFLTVLFSPPFLLVPFPLPYFCSSLIHFPTFLNIVFPFFLSSLNVSSVFFPFCITPFPLFF